MVNKRYHINKQDDTLIFTTTSYKAEKTSVLHKGIYTKEFSSMLFASATGMFAYFIIRLISNETGLIHYIITILIFIVTFVGANSFIFNEKHLRVVFDRTNKTVTIIRYGIIRKNIEEIPFGNIESIKVGSRRFTPENIDGIRFVEKISLQHGSAIPGLGDEEEFVTLSLKLTDGSERIIYAGKIEDEPEIPLKEIKNFLGK
jgi:hypothetical protein